MDILTGKKIVIHLGCYNGHHLLVNFSTLRGIGNVIKMVDGGIIILARCMFHFIRVPENLVQHPSNNIWIKYYTLHLLQNFTAKIEEQFY